MKRLCASDLRKIFYKSIESVQPATLFSAGNCLKPIKGDNGNELLSVCGEIVSISDKKCHLVGFGKAVLGMAVQMERILGKRLVSGIISIPVGTLAKFHTAPDMNLSRDSVIKIFEGAKHNLPDLSAMAAAKNIKKLAESMTGNDILFVLISGGGSALLPLPLEPITLQQKTELIRNLARKGADIEELNIVRIGISQTKGGKLAYSARDAHKIFSLVISDIVNDPLHLIASGPTVEFKSDGRTPRGILEKYELWHELDAKIKEIFLLGNQMPLKSTPNSLVHIIGSNKVAAEAAMNCAQNLGYKSCILSTSISGSLENIVQLYTQILLKLLKYQNYQIDENELFVAFPFNKESFQHCLNTVQSCRPGDTMCLVLAGEPTAFVKGDGQGGRNQELALRMSKAFYESELFKDICFLSAGTDGIDGPTDSAGAIGSAEVIHRFITANHTGRSYQDFIDRNDSYNFYKIVNHGKYHIKTGHTGTNVMDIHLIMVPVKGPSKL